MPATKSAQIPWWRKTIYALIPMSVLLLGMEGFLAWLGVEPKTLRDEDPYVGFSESVPLMMQVPKADGSARMVTRPSKLNWFNRQLFDRTKPPNTYRVFCLGGSTTYGRPFSDKTSYCGWLRELLPLVDSRQDWEVINAGGISYASYRVAAVMKELSQFEPDLFIVYTGHNEFLEQRTYQSLINRPAWWLQLDSGIRSTRTYAIFDRILPNRNESPDRQRDWLPGEVDERLNHTIGPADYERDAEWKHHVVKHYELNLQRMVRLAEQAGAAIVFVQPAANEKDCRPFKSLSGTEETQAVAGRSTNPWREMSLQELTLAAESDPMHAEVRYELGRALFRTQDYERASTEFHAALNEDICPLRAIDELQLALQETVQRESVGWVPFQTRLRELCRQEYGHPILGDEYFLDHVHPTIEAHRELAWWIIDALEDQGIVATGTREAEGFSQQVQRVIDDVMRSVSQTDHGISLRNLAKVLHWSGKFEEAANRASDALELLRNDSESRFILADCLKNMGQPDRAVQQYAFLMEDDPQYFRAYLPLGELLLDQGDVDRAEYYLEGAKVFEPDNPYLYFTLGRFWMSKSRWAEAQAALARADQLYPNDGETQRLLEICKQRSADER